jgi:hypothetical protein
MIRIQLELPEEQVQSLDKLMETINLRTRKDLFNNALTLLEWAVKEKSAGRTIASIDDESKRIKELLMPVLESVPALKSRSKTVLVASR